MERSESKSRDVADSRSLSEAVRRARIRVAEDFDDTANRRVSELARLDMLKGELEGIFEQIPDSGERFELVLVPSLPVRLWIDPFAYVMREPNSGLYCFVRNAEHGPKVLGEAASVGEMADRIMDYIADELVKRERQLSGYTELERRLTPQPPPPAPPPKPAIGTAIWAFVIGMLTGVTGYLAYLFLTT